MWMIVLAVALNLIGLLVAIRAVFVLSGEGDGERPGAFSARSVGLAGLLLGAFVLMGTGQFLALALLHQATQYGRVAEGDEAFVDAVTRGGAVCGAVLVVIGGVLVRLRRPTGAGAARGLLGRGATTAVVVLAALLVLAGLNVYQYLAYLRQPAQPQLTDQQPRRESTVDVVAGLQTAGDQVTRAFARRFHDQVFAIEKNRPTWLGIETLQNPNDAWITQELIHDVKPDYIVETGTYNGGSALFWAMVLRQVNPNGRVLTVDIADTSQEARQRPIWKERIDFFLGSSTDPQIVEEIRNRVSGGRVLVILDSHHAYEHVLQELKMYAPLVDVGSYIIVQDTYIDYPPAFHPQLGPGPWKAVEEFMTGNEQFVFDDTRLRMLFTFNPRSQLKRVKPAAQETPKQTPNSK